jgi:hypothetical protein
LIDQGFGFGKLRIELTRSEGLDVRLASARNA